MEKINNATKPVKFYGFDTIFFFHFQRNLNMKKSEIKKKFDKNWSKTLILKFLSRIWFNCQVKELYNYYFTFFQEIFVIQRKFQLNIKHIKKLYFSISIKVQSKSWYFRWNILIDLLKKKEIFWFINQFMSKLF